MGMQHSFLQILLSIVTVRCCISFGSSGCLSSGATLGGKLVFTRKSGQDVAEPPSWISGKRLVLVTGRFPLKRTVGFGRGRIWTGQRGCRSGFSQSTCLSSNGNLPCFEDLVDKANTPSYSKQKTQVLQFTEVSPTSIIVTWPAWNQDTDVGSGPVSKYQIEFKEAGETEFRVFSAGTNLTYLFENLKEDTDYEFRVVIFRDHATHAEGPPSDVQIQRTLPRPPSYRAKNVISFNDVTPTSVNVTWPAWRQDLGGGSGPISEYQIKIREEGQTQFRVVSVGTSLTYLFKNLSENTDYEFCLVVFRNHSTHGEGPPSNVQTQRTLPRPPSYRADNVILFNDVTPTSVNVTWPAWKQDSNLGSGPISEYQIKIREEGQTQFRVVSVGTSLTYLFKNLSENTDYEFRLVVFRNHSTHGEGPPSNVQTHRTLSRHVPSYSQSRSDILQFSDVTSTSIGVSWPAWDQTTDVGSGPIAEYKIQMKEKFTDVFRTILVGKRLSYIFKNLTEDTEYEFRVAIVSVNPNGEGPPSPTQTFKTPCGVHKEDVLLFLTTPNWRRGKVVIAKWQMAERQTSCGAIKKFLKVELMDLDGCPTHSSETIESFDLGDTARDRMILRDKKPYSLYRVTLSVAYGDGEFFNMSDEIRTLNTEPTLMPQNLKVEVVGRGMLKFEWTKPPCGGCNGNITKYQTSFSVRGRERKDTTEETSKVYFGLKEGDRYTFKVKAETSYGRGPYTEPGCTSVFGTDIC